MEWNLTSVFETSPDGKTRGLTIARGEARSHDCVKRAMG